jgi:hypothetical protein
MGEVGQSFEQKVEVQRVERPTWDRVPSTLTQTAPRRSTFSPGWHPG